MTTIDLSTMNQMLNMSNVFKLYISQMLADRNSGARQKVKLLRENLRHQIRHIDRNVLNEIAGELVKRTSNYSILTRLDIEKALNRAHVYKLLSACALFEDEGLNESVLFLLTRTPAPYKRVDLLQRFDFVIAVEQIKKTDSHA